jgi:hypothetical protein
MTRLVPYAGYDPDEDDFSDIVLPPHWRYDFGKNMARRRQRIDPAIVRIICAAEIPHRIVGQLVATLYRRRMPYLSRTIGHVLRKGHVA